jgi:hypothetical protein
MEHCLKTDGAVFDAVRSGAKTYELRFDDRGFAVGDTIELHRTRYTAEEMRSGAPFIYTDDLPIRIIITHVLRGPIYGLLDGWVIFEFQAET